MLYAYATRFDVIGNLETIAAALRLSVLVLQRFFVDARGGGSSAALARGSGKAHMSGFCFCARRSMKQSSKMSSAPEF
jgi:hypothetical protein